MGFKDGAADVRAVPFGRPVRCRFALAKACSLTFAMSPRPAWSQTRRATPSSQKATEGGRRSRSRDDAAAAGILAVAAGRRRANTPARAPRSFVA